MKNRLFSTALKMMAIMLSFFTAMNLSTIVVYAESTSEEISGHVYTFGEKDHYEYTAAEEDEEFRPGDNTYGTLSVKGDISFSGYKNGLASYAVNGGTADILYTYGDKILSAGDDEWHLVEDKTKKVAGIKLDSDIKKGALILQTSKDGQSWINNRILTNVFADTQVQSELFYKANNVQLANGCYYRVIVAWEKAVKTGQTGGVFGTGVGKKDTYNYVKTAEVYEFYLYDVTSVDKTDNSFSRNLGVLTKTEKDSGYSGSKEIGIKDPHYGWELGQFFVSGYTRETEKDSTPVFLKNVEDQITLWFNLKQDINQLNEDDRLSINDDANGYDQYFQTAKTDMGRGALIIRYTDAQGVKHDPEVYTNYLEANATNSADTIVKLFEEGDYEVALDYEIKSTPRRIAGVEVVPEYTNYRIFFTFSVRNGNCMVYPFDVKTGAELSNEAITENGFKLDMAKSRYLNIDVQRAVVTEEANGYTEDIRFNRPAKDGDEYKDEGIYTFSVKNLYTGESTTKTIYVGDTEYMRALSVNSMTVKELNGQVALGGIIERNGTITVPESETEPETEAVNYNTVYDENEDQVTDTSAESSEDMSLEEFEGSKKTPIMPTALGGVVIICTVAAFIMMNKKKKG